MSITGGPESGRVNKVNFNPFPSMLEQKPYIPVAESTPEQFTRNADDLAHTAVAGRLQVTNALSERPVSNAGPAAALAAAVVLLAPRLAHAGINVEGHLKQAVSWFVQGPTFEFAKGTLDRLDSGGGDLAQFTLNVGAAWMLLQSKTLRQGVFPWLTYAVFWKISLIIFLLGTRLKALKGGLDGILNSEIGKTGWNLRDISIGVFGSAVAVGWLAGPGVEGMTNGLAAPALTVAGVFGGMHAVRSTGAWIAGVAGDEEKRKWIQHNVTVRGALGGVFGGIAPNLARKAWALAGSAREALADALGPKLGRAGKWTGDMIREKRMVACPTDVAHRSPPGSKFCGHCGTGIPQGENIWKRKII